MNPSFDYGARLSDQQYERKIVALHSHASESPKSEESAELRRRELDLAIDNRLGTEFPQDRRDALWEVQQRVEKKRAQLIFRHFFRRLFSRQFMRGAQGVAAWMVSEYATVLDDAELKSYFGLESAEQAALPVEPEQLSE